ncbi:MAG TPA: sigma-70 family RNA polymerase sigma factor [Pseudolysinimonas sp.]|nr:sigma-70 family RNA polymerase sigma factor [Pseudolysinimonas sp.]
MTALSPAVPRLAPRVVIRSAAMRQADPARPQAESAVTHRADDRADPRQFDVTEFVLTEYPRVVSAVRMIAGDRDAAVDAVHEALVQLLTDRDRAWPRNVAAWVTVVASNRARDVHRRDAVGRRVVDRLRPSAPEDPLERVGRDLDVLAALQTLPQRMRQVCVLHYLQDQSVREIAEALGISTGTVKTQLHRSRIALARRLGP